MIVDSSRPQVCAACLWMYKAFLRLGFGCHGLFQSAFLHLFRKTKGKSGQQELADALNSVLFALTGCEDMSALAKPEELATATLTSSDIPVAKKYKVSVPARLAIGLLDQPLQQKSWLLL